MWIELRSAVWWLIGFWLPLLAGCAIVATRGVTSPPTAEQQKLIVAAPQKLFAALKLVLIIYTKPPLKPNEFRFISLVEATREFHCAKFTQSASSLERQLLNLPDTLFIPTSVFDRSESRVRFDWIIRDSGGATYTGELDEKKQRLCLEPTAYELTWTPVIAQWQSNFQMAVLIASPLYLLGFAVFSLVVWARTRFLVLKWLGALMFFAATGLAVYIGILWAVLAVSSGNL